MKFGYSSSRDFPPVVKNLLIINGLMFLVSYVMSMRGMDPFHTLGMHYPTSEFFQPWQIVTHLFMHAGWGHLFFNMFALWMFGRNLELIWGQKRFFNFYFLTAFGALLLYYLVILIQLQGATELAAYYMINTPVVGASGAVMGLLGATYALFPNSTIYLYFAIPIKMKWFTLGLAVLSLYLGLAQHQGDNVAHFAHLGGLLAGIFIVRYWNKSNRNSFY